MSFLDKLTSKVTEAAQATASKTKDLTESTKLTLSISTEEENVKKAYLKLGEAYYRYAANAEGLPDDLKIHVDAINTSKIKIEEAKSKKSEMKDEAICEKCGAKNNKSLKFCPSCGSELGGQAGE